MSKTYGRIKGRAYEREIYKDLKPLIPDIRLTMGSGSGSIEKADLYSDELKIIIECKRWRKMPLKNLILFWDKLVKQAMDEQYMPYLIFRENMGESMVMTGLHKKIEGSHIFRIPVLIKYAEWKLKQFADTPRIDPRILIAAPTVSQIPLAYVKPPENYHIDYSKIWETTEDEDLFIEKYAKIVTHETIHLEQIKALLSLDGAEKVVEVMLNDNL